MNPNLEKENSTGTNTDGANANRPLRVLTASSIIGDKVENKNGESIGNIKDIMLNITDGKVEYIIVETGSFLGLGGKLFAIPYSAIKKNPHKRDFILDVPKDFMENAPGFDTNHWPETNSHYTEVNTHWGDFMGPNVGNV